MLRFFCSLFMLAASCIAHAQDAKDSIAIVQVIKADYKALGENDVEARRRNCTPDYQLIEDGELWNLEKEIDFMLSRKGQSMSRTDTFHFYSLQVKGSMAFAVYDLRSSITRAGTTKYYHWIESAVLVWSGGGWKIRLIHSTKAN